MVNQGTVSRGWRSRWHGWGLTSGEAEVTHDSGLSLLLVPADHPGNFDMNLASPLPAGYLFDSFHFWRLQTEALRHYQEKFVGLGHRKVLIKVPRVDGIIVEQDDGSYLLAPGSIQAIRRESKDRYNEISEDDVRRVIDDWSARWDERTGSDRPR